MKFLILKRKNIWFALVLIIIFAFCAAMQFVGVNSNQKINSPIYSYTIVIDAGHGGIDPGGIGIKTKVKESELNLSVTKILEQYLTAFGVKVVLTRASSAGLYGTSTKGYKKRDMLARRTIIEENNADMVVSIHMNRYVRSSLRGAQVFYDASSEEGKSLALCIQNMFAQNIPCSDKGISIGNFYMLQCTSAPSVLCECGYLSNEEDEKLLQDPVHQDKIAYNIFCGIVNYLNLSSSLI